MCYILAIDQGTTSTTVLILNEKLEICATASQEFPQIYPQPDYIEHAPDAIWQSVLEAIGTAIARARIDARQIVAIGIANQRETTVLWDKTTENPIYNAIVWQCRRTTNLCNALKADKYDEILRQKTGLLCDPYFSATKIRWILDHCDAQTAAENGRIAFGTIDTFLLHKLTGGRVHATDPTNASRTLLMNLRSLSWDDDLLKLFNIPRAILPSISSNNAIFGRTRHVPGLPDGIPISGVMGDQQAALFGQTCFQPGDAKCTFGTGAFLLLNTGADIVHSKHGLIATCAWKIGQNTSYALEGSAFIAGALIQWLRDGLQIIQSADEIEKLAQSVDDTGGLILVPALTGLGAPHWRPQARGLLCGITRATTRAHIARAALLGICHQNTDLFNAMLADSSQNLIVKVDGGASRNNLLMQMQADLLNTPLIRPKNHQTTALGAAMCAALGIGMFQNLDALRAAFITERVFTPQKNDAWRQRERQLWKNAVCHA